MKFTKMQGLGNDFVILEPQEVVGMPGCSLSVLARNLCDRKFGIGADGLIIIDKNVKNTDIGWFFYNSDGTLAQMCGNGMRCFAKYVYDKKIIDKKEFSVETLAGTIIPRILDNGCVRVNMSKPVLESEKIPCKSKKNLNFEIEALDKRFVANAVSMGNPHCVIFTDGDTKALALKYGPIIECDEFFPEKTNVEFVKVLSENRINLDVWERSCGITLACGTGACAAVVAGVLNGILDHNVEVNLPGGVLNIEYQGNLADSDHDVFMSGDAQYVFEGETLANACYYL